MSLKKPEIPEGFPDVAQVLKGKVSSKDFAKNLIEWYKRPEVKEYQIKLAQYAEHQEAENVTHLMDRLQDLEKRGYEVVFDRVPLPKGGMSTLVAIAKDGYAVHAGFPDFFEPSFINLTLKELLLTLDLSLEQKMAQLSDRAREILFKHQKSGLALGTAELAEILGKTRSTISKLARENSSRLPKARRVGSFWYFHPRDVEEWIRSTNEL